MALPRNIIDENDGRLPQILTGWGNALINLGRLEEALDMQLEAIKLCRNVPNDKNDQYDAMTIVQMNWADVENDPETPYTMYPCGERLPSAGKSRRRAGRTHKSPEDMYPLVRRSSSLRCWFVIQDRRNSVLASKQGGASPASHLSL